jgi:AcrR family transcriptional regulator
VATPRRRKLHVRRPRAKRDPVARPTWDRRPNPRRREELLAGVSAFLLEKGLGEFSLRRAADASGTSAQLLVHYFGTKDRLVAEALASISAAWIGSVFDQGDMGLENFEDLYWRSWRSFTSEEYLRHLRLMYEVLSKAFRNPAPFRHLLDTITVGWQTRFADALTAVGMRVGPARRISTFYLAALRGLLLDLLATGDLDRVTDAAGLVLENLQRDVFAALGSEPPAPETESR